MPVNFRNTQSTKQPAKSKAKQKQARKPPAGGHAPEVDLFIESESESELIAQPKYETSSYKFIAY